ncbi:hypothetical protein COV53_05980 [Candidatus Gottesmanbacteria bacterium CG11_big_fil_rev_8_21_14_0_20_37_11]|uniref:tRNA/rRNA methyltransferase SpoU type domain-containing protein n=3 Tax=Candidatus Gottesmaniibacteriota TaxID=1752720 RepID=A0A2M7RR90_9BACT|nr:MAG: hypothetical protein AUJ73_02670 [Candidatus Gottesmanbacteria bacterium CG1_02_37_22]PIP32153.1 MAG: hypothetical protein COX23_06310 [Candidatus Gottesmanbacteria bacterium CG23_combo_of_CG06-09_8_20_14_all_37_19]PIR07881.1 MAG: hypothetical protein COV53_05980 [Candidatus Gottesmanbacteria bacterium CG11_big_fil_rev_8_21_14_0_20_37_11]PIZ02569.1 MAG: hypothetical protein COY59_04100 [Candidatus Gottesmanbacteria bacterium CG_4_10_14_0_8_um_filter_37_24]
MIKFNAKELRNEDPNDEVVKSVVRNPIYIILDNVLDTYNIGSIFRLADAVAAEKLILCAESETPPNPRIKKASINTWKWTPWEYRETALQAVTNLKSQDETLKIICVEQDRRSIGLSGLECGFPLALVVGNETYGISKEVLKEADIIVELPMYGINKSLNVMVSCGIVLYKILEKNCKNPP